MDYDLIIIGAGWAGVSAAHQALCRGLKTALIEYNEIGGTCLNRGCIPTKSLLESTEKSVVKNFDLAQAQRTKEELVLSLRRGLHSTLKGVQLYSGRAAFVDPGHVSVEGKIISAGSIIIATGSQPRQLDALPFDRQRIVSSDEMLLWDKAPESLLIVGGGALGMEFADLFASCGARVTVLEAQSRVLPAFDADIGKKVAVSFEKKGISVRTGPDAASFDASGFEKVAVCAGRKPLIEGLALEKTGIALSASGITVNNYLRTSHPSIYAVGDCNGLNLQAHAASLQARIAVDTICAGEKQVLPFSAYAVAQAVFTRPQAAGVGLTEALAVAGGAQAKARSLGCMANGMSRIRGEKDGLLKVVWNDETDRLLGAWIFGAHAAEQISFFTLALQSGLTRSQCRQAVMVHPSLSEILVEVLQ